MDEIIQAARKAVEDEVRHTHESLFMLLAQWFPEASDEELEEAVEIVLT